MMDNPLLKAGWACQNRLKGACPQPPRTRSLRNWGLAQSWSLPALPLPAWSLLWEDELGGELLPGQTLACWGPQGEPLAARKNCWEILETHRPSRHPQANELEL